VEITREFSLKFQKIVQQEQGANFISRLHREKLDTIPWPVIESKEFYKLFSTLKKRLDSQKTSYHCRRIPSYHQNLDGEVVEGQRLGSALSDP